MLDETTEKLIKRIAKFYADSENDTQLEDDIDFEDLSKLTELLKDPQLEIYFQDMIKEFKKENKKRRRKKYE